MYMPTFRTRTTATIDGLHVVVCVSNRSHFHCLSFFSPPSVQRVLLKSHPSVRLVVSMSGYFPHQGRLLGCYSCGRTLDGDLLASSDVPSCVQFGVACSTSLCIPQLQHKHKRHQQQHLQQLVSHSDTQPYQQHTRINTNKAGMWSSAPAATTNAEFDNGLAHHTNNHSSPVGRANTLAAPATISATQWTAFGSQHNACTRAVPSADPRPAPGSTLLSRRLRSCRRHHTSPWSHASQATSCTG
jgi:hypothetical protein